MNEPTHRTYVSQYSAFEASLLTEREQEEFYDVPSDDDGDFLCGGYVPVERERSEALTVQVLISNETDRATALRQLEKIMEWIRQGEDTLERMELAGTEPVLF